MVSRRVMGVGGWSGRGVTSSTMMATNGWMVATCPRARTSATPAATANTNPVVSHAAMINRLFAMSISKKRPAIRSKGYLKYEESGFIQKCLERGMPTLIQAYRGPQVNQLRPGGHWPPVLRARFRSATKTASVFPVARDRPKRRGTGTHSMQDPRWPGHEHG